MNILFIGPYRQDDEWGCKSRAILQCLQKTEHNITSRPIYLSSANTYNKYEESAESVVCDEYDILIQYVLPSFAIYDGNFKKRIGIFHTETIPNNIPIAELTHEYLMDEIWVDSKVVATQLQNVLTHYAVPENTSTIVKAIPPILNLNELPEIPSVQSIRDTSPHLKDRFVFYYIGNILDPQSGFKEIYTAYLHTFTIHDPVALVIGLDTRLQPQMIEGCLQGHKKSIIYNRPDRLNPVVNVVTPRQNHLLTVQERLAIHTGGDCMIHLAYPMTNPVAVLEGALYHNTPIVTRNGVIDECLGEDHLWCVDSYEEICMRSKETVPNKLYRYTNEESWYRPITKSITEIMKQAYVNKFQRDKKTKANKNLRHVFQNTSYNNYISI